MWDSVETMCRQFYDTSIWVAERSGFEVNRKEADNSLLYLHKVKELGPDYDETDIRLVRLKFLSEIGN